MTKNNDKYLRDTYMDKEERMRELFKTIHKPISSSSEFKERLLTTLIAQLGSQTAGSSTPVWKRSWLWVAVTVIIVLAVVGSVVWLSRPETPPTIISPDVPSEESPVTPEGPSEETPVTPEGPSEETPETPEGPSEETPETPEGPSEETPVTPEGPSEETPVAPEGPVKMANFRLLISDEVNAIEYFKSLKVTISGAGLLPATEEEGEEEWLLLEMEEEDWCTVDLKDLQEENAKEIWSGYVDPGDYTKVFIYVENITWVLESGDDADVILPSNKLQISSPFTVGEDDEVNFVFDVTVVEAGGSGQYIIKPQLAQSGPDKSFKLVSHDKDSEDTEEFEQSEEEIGLNLDWYSLPNGAILLVVSDNGTGVEGAKVTETFNGKKVLQARTDSSGSAEIKLPETAGILKIEVTFRGKRGELEIEVPIQQ